MRKMSMLLCFMYHFGFKNIKIQIYSNTNEKEYVMEWNKEKEEA